MKMSNYYYMIAIVLSVLVMTSCEEDEDLLRLGAVVGQPQEIDPALDYEFPDDKEVPLKRDLLQPIKKPQLPIEKRILRNITDIEDDDLKRSDDLGIIANEVRATTLRVDKDVMVFDYDEMIIIGLRELIIPAVSKEKIDNSTILAYYNPSEEVETAWYVMPGISSSGKFNIRTALYQSGSDVIFVIKTMFPLSISFNESVSLRGVKIYIVPNEVNNSINEIVDNLQFDIVS